MARRYDSRTTIFSPEGRLYQVEYAMEAISHAGTALGVTSKEGIVLAAEKKVTSKLLDETKASEKIYPINDQSACSVAGLTSDANILIQYARQSAQDHFMTYGNPMPIEQLAQKLCDLKQGYTQYGGLRPFGVSFLIAGWDQHFGFQLYHTDPSGNYSGWKAHCIGANHGPAQSLLKQEYQPDISLDQAKMLALKVLTKTMETTKLSSEKLEFGTLTLEDDGSGSKRVVFKMFKPKELDTLLAEFNAQQPADSEK